MVSVAVSVKADLKYSLPFMDQATAARQNSFSKPVYDPVFLPWSNRKVHSHFNPNNISSKPNDDEKTPAINPLSLLTQGQIKANFSKSKLKSGLVAFFTDAATTAAAPHTRRKVRSLKNLGADTRKKKENSSERKKNSILSLSKKKYLKKEVENETNSWRGLPKKTGVAAASPPTHVVKEVPTLDVGESNFSHLVNRLIGPMIDVGGFLLLLNRKILAPLTPLVYCEKIFYLKTLFKNH